MIPSLADQHWVDAFSNIASDYLTSLICAGVPLMIAVAVEARVRHARPPSGRHAWFNVRYTLVMLAILAATRPLTLIASLALTRALGLGWIVFGEGAMARCAAFVVLLLATDLLEYLFHRAQHTFSFLWKMHEFHHSAEHYNVTVSYRHCWLEPLIKTSLLYPLLGIALRVPSGVAIAVNIVFLLNHHVQHMNLRYSPRFLSLLVSHPQYHRLHHSRHERHYNRNFCDLLTLWDILFRTQARLLRDEHVDVGLDSGEAPQTVVQALLWPWRRQEKPVGARQAQ